MLDEEILELRRKLDESITKEKNYDKTYKLSVELDELITKYYNKKLKKKISDEIFKSYK
ncbi:MAG: aspartyl-phosphate phosphatase Spo0E family protein [Clostridia bacterium]|nr:aspartyl-phosphate phosphatase Spo0E family protein [Clostridia bacterium]